MYLDALSRMNLPSHVWIDGNRASEVPNCSRIKLTHFCARPMDSQANLGDMLRDWQQTLLPGQEGGGALDGIALSWTMFPVVYASAYAAEVVVAPFAAVFTPVRWATGGTADDGTSPLFESPSFIDYRTTRGTTVSVDVSYIGKGRGSRDTILSIMSGIEMARVPDGYHLYLFPMVSGDQYNARRGEFGGIDGRSAWAFGGASLGLAVFMAGIGGFPALYTGYLSSLLLENSGNTDTLVSGAAYSADIEAARQKRAIRDGRQYKPLYADVDWGPYKVTPPTPLGETFKATNFVETVDDIPIKLVLPLMAGLCIVIPAKTQYNTDMQAAARAIAMGMAGRVKTQGRRSVAGLPQGRLGFPAGSDMDIMSIIRDTEFFASAQLQAGKSMILQGAQVLCAATGLEAAIFSVLIAHAFATHWNPNPNQGDVDAAMDFKSNVDRTIFPKKIREPVAPRAGLPLRINVGRAKRLQAFHKFKDMLTALRNVGITREQASAYYASKAQQAAAAAAQAASTAVGVFASAPPQSPSQQVAAGHLAAIVPAARQVAAGPPLVAGLGAPPVVSGERAQPGRSKMVGVKASPAALAAVRMAQQTAKAAEAVREKQRQAAMTRAAEESPEEEEFVFPGHEPWLMGDQPSAQPQPSKPGHSAGEWGEAAGEWGEAAGDMDDLGDENDPSSEAHGLRGAANAIVNAAEHPDVLSQIHPAQRLAHLMKLAGDELHMHFGTPTVAISAAKPAPARKAAGTSSGKRRAVTGKSAGTRNIRGNPTSTKNLRTNKTSTATKKVAGSAAAIRRAPRFAKKDLVQSPRYLPFYESRQLMAPRRTAAMRDLFAGAAPEQYEAWTHSRFPGL
jgi:hypothetical protein